MTETTARQWTPLTDHELGIAAHGEEQRCPGPLAWFMCLATMTEADKIDMMDEHRLVEFWHLVDAAKVVMDLRERIVALETQQRASTAA